MTHACAGLLQGLLSMANTGPDSNTSHFSVMVDAAPHLDGHYTIFGEAVDGFEVRAAGVRPHGCGWMLRLPVTRVALNVEFLKLRWCCRGCCGVRVVCKTFGCAVHRRRLRRWLLPLLQLLSTGWQRLKHSDRLMPAASMHHLSHAC